MSCLRFALSSFERVEVQSAFQNTERFVLSKDLDGQEITDMGPKAFDFLPQGCLGPSDLPAVEVNGCRRREPRPQISERGTRVGRAIRESNW